MLTTMPSESVAERAAGRESLTPSMVAEAREAELLDRMRQEYVSEYGDLVSTWQSLETKAQGTVAIAGIFLAASFNFAREIPAGTGYLQRGVLAVCVVALTAAILFAIGALRVRSIFRRPGGSSLDQQVQALSRGETLPSDSQLLRMDWDFVRGWRAVIEEFASANGRKARALRRAHTVLAIGALAVSALTVYSILTFNAR